MRALLHSLCVHSGAFALIVFGADFCIPQKSAPSSSLESGAFMCRLATVEPEAAAETLPELAAELPTEVVQPPALVEQKPVLEVSRTEIPRELWAGLSPAVNAAGAPLEKPVPQKRKAASASAKKGGTTGAGKGDAGGKGGGGDNAGYVAPRYLTRHNPAYPKDAREKRLQGVVILRATIDPKGRVSGVSIAESCGFPLLDAAAKEALITWRFYPAMLNGSPVEGRVEVPIRFSLGGRA